MKTLDILKEMQQTNYMGSPRNILSKNHPPTTSSSSTFLILIAIQHMIQEPDITPPSSFLTREKLAILTKDLPHQ